MRLWSETSDRQRSAGRGSWPQQARDACCLLVALVFAARAAAGLVLPEGFAPADRACESESSAEELESDESGESLELACLGSSPLLLIEGPSLALAVAAATTAAPLILPALLARGPPA